MELLWLHVTFLFTQFAAEIAEPAFSLTDAQSGYFTITCVQEHMVRVLLSD